MASAQTEGEAAPIDAPAPEEPEQVVETESDEEGGEEKRKDKEEDVCFICKDGGDLIMCDRWTCPKSFHLECIGKGDEFMNLKGRWSCGYHFCIKCNSKTVAKKCLTCMAAQYCKACYAEVQEEAAMIPVPMACKPASNNPFALCHDCQPMVMMIEGMATESGSKGVDWHDYETEEGLFQDYWRLLKGMYDVKTDQLKALLDPDAQAAPEQPKAPKGAPSKKRKKSDLQKLAQKQAGGGSKAADSQRKQRRKKREDPGQKSLYFDSSSSSSSSGGSASEDEEEPGPSIRVFDSWASPQILDFLRQRGEAVDVPIPRFKVNKLLWAYIKEKGLNEGGKVVCDPMLQMLFACGSTSMLDMAKKLTLHFPTGQKKLKKASEGTGRGPAADGPSTGAARKTQGGGGAGAEAGHRAGAGRAPGGGGAAGAGEREGPVDEYYKTADVTEHNVELVYLPRQKMEALLKSPDFDEVVINTYVRIRSSASVYRLMLVMEAFEGEEAYRVKDGSCTKMLRVKNMDKLQDYKIIDVSPQPFTAEEIRRLHSAVFEFEFYPKMLKGEVEDKYLQLAEASQDVAAVRQKLVNLRERASVLGNVAEHRRIAEQLQELDKTGRLASQPATPRPRVDVLAPPRPAQAPRAFAYAVAPEGPGAGGGRAREAGGGGGGEEGGSAWGRGERLPGEVAPKGERQIPKKARAEAAPLPGTRAGRRAEAQGPRTGTRRRPRGPASARRAPRRARSRESPPQPPRRRAPVRRRPTSK